MSSKPGGLRTPLTRVRFLGSAQKGTGEAWMVQVTGIANVLLGLIFVLLMLRLVHMDYNGVRATLGHPIPAILLLAFILSGIVHMEIGMRSIIVDYVSGPARQWALIANVLVSGLLGLACMYATLRISFI
ncbi:succinate dehydrogenase subunit D [Roseiarcus fermentans]|uniref:Succinate dehydrogenase hydrophobic membrane anchor subunit n=1 Tax=Roseiarcus fermentans TaxID=1473586 RepID=A0A366FHY3_9HYPH|nr:succinate dehydrogenase, hydrophobic membrane anchor protein [Roseiarcus fermentans]RBP14268.1 succinate dehydrogenase subunit D [Roseiarcus fermentans]